MNPWKVQIKRRRKGGYLVYVWESDKEVGSSQRVEGEEELRELLDGLYRLGGK